MPNETGWKPIPLSLKILFVVFILWALGSIFAVPMRYELGLPLLGMWISGIAAALVVVALDIVAPLVFLFALWTRKSWGALFALSYIGFFMVNSVVASFTHGDQLGIPAVLVPLLANGVFAFLIFRRRDYFQ